MAISRPFDDAMAELCEERRDVLVSLIRNTAEAFLEGSPEAGVMLRHCIQSTEGFDAFARKTGIQVSELRRLARARGNLSTARLALILDQLQTYARVKLHVQADDQEAEAHTEKQHA